MNGVREEYVASYLEGSAAELVSESLEGRLSEEHGVMCSYMLASWEQTDMQIMFAELIYDSITDQLLAQIVLYQKNEIKKKFYRVDTPMPFAVMFAAYCSVPMVMDDATVRALGRTDIDDLLKSAKERNQNGKEAGN
jgi:hypothetical protein